MRTSRTSLRRVLFCAPLPPEFDRESGSRRVYHLLMGLRSRARHVSFVCENAPSTSPHLRHLRQLGISTFVGFGRDTEEHIRAASFDLAVFAFWHQAHRRADVVRRLSPATRILVDSVDLHWLRKARRILGGRDSETSLLDERYASDFLAEMNAYARADGVLTVSRKEARLINDMVGSSEVASAVPDWDEVPEDGPPFEDRRGVVFVGNFRHPPNLDAVEYLCGEVLPLLPGSLRSEHPVRVVGNEPPQRVFDLAAGCGEVQVVGWVPSLLPYLHAARVSVVPLRYGAGTKRKLIQSLLAGTPAVASSPGVEGFDLVPEEDLLVADGPRDFAAALERLLHDGETWRRLASRGREKVLSLHGRASSEACLYDVIDRIMRRPAKTQDRPGVAGEDRAPHEEGTGVGNALRSVVPPRSRVLVVSKGDPDLVQFSGYRTSHFPQGPDGSYAGYHPRDSRQAVRHLEELRTEADFLLFPATAFWWLDYYAGFARHLKEHAVCVWSDKGCRIFGLLPNATKLKATRGPAGERRAPEPPSLFERGGTRGRERRDARGAQGGGPR